MTNQISLELVSVARYQLEELLETLPDAPFSVEFATPSLSEENLGELFDLPIDSVHLSARWSDTLGHALSLDLHDFTAAKLRYFLDEVAGDADLFPELFLQDPDGELIELELESGVLIIEWEDQAPSAGPVEGLDLDDEENWDEEVHHWAQEIEAEASRTQDPELRASLRRRVALLLGVAEYAGRYEDLDD